MTNQKLDNIGFFEYILQTLRMQSVPKRVGRADEAENLWAWRIQTTQRRVSRPQRRTAFYGLLPIVILVTIDSGFLILGMCHKYKDSL